MQANFKNNGVILRLAGLVGQERHPVKYLAGKTNIAKPFAEINLVHAEEILAFIELLLNNWNGGIFNLCNPDHPLKMDYYNALARELKLAVPEFNKEDKSLGKRVNSNRLKDLNFEYKYKVLTDYPKPKFS